MSFETGLSGLNAASRNLDVIGNNIANANTTGMKASRTEFADIVASSIGGRWQFQRNWRGGWHRFTDVFPGEYQHYRE